MSDEPTLVIRGATLIDGTSAAAEEGSLIIVRGNRIETVGSAADTSVPPNAEVIEASGKYSMPGLIDAHAPLKSVNGFGPER